MNSLNLISFAHQMSNRNMSRQLDRTVTALEDIYPVIKASSVRSRPIRTDKRKCEKHTVTSCSESKLRKLQTFTNNKQTANLGLSDVANHTKKQSSKRIFSEVQICYEGEAGLPKTYDECQKNPEHRNFISVNEFGMERLPSNYQDDDILKLVKSLQVLTCRLKVRPLSGNRTESYALSPFHQNVESSCFSSVNDNVPRVGSGFVSFVTRMEGCHKYCQCLECEESGTPKMEFWEVKVDTAIHVVENDIKETEVEFFFDEKHREDVKILKGLRMLERAKYKENDWCRFVCHTHDMEFGKLLEEKRSSCMDLNEKINKKMNDEFPGLEHRLNVIISHPHGSPKKISVGKWFEKIPVGEWSTRYTYDTCTCIGSSGAMVWRLGCLTDRLFRSHPHMGIFEGGPLNVSGIGLDYDRKSSRPCFMGL